MVQGKGACSNGLLCTDERNAVLEKERGLALTTTTRQDRGSCSRRCFLKMHAGQEINTRPACTLACAAHTLPECSQERAVLPSYTGCHWTRGPVCKRVPEGAQIPPGPFCSLAGVLGSAEGPCAGGAPASAPAGLSLT